MTSSLAARLEGPQPASQVALDIVRRGLLAGPLLVGIGWGIWGSDGASSVAYALGLVLLNFWLSAAIISFTSKISLALLMVGAMFGFLIRLGIIFVAFWVVKDASWIDVVALGVTIIVSHLGLLIWEMKYVSANLAYPGLKPKKKAINV